MPVIGLSIIFVGYSVAYYGMTQLQGGNWGFWDLTIPTRWTVDKAKTKRDGK